MSTERRGKGRARISEQAERGPKSTYERMVAEGRIQPATRDLLDIKPLPALKGKQVSEILREMREDDESPA
ncbi:MAG TPA: hypothetical protein VK736_04540 [Candidatus Binatia bacterium]|nr:hypothetical protein [Candidatus Binatia bacterium]